MQWLAAELRILFSLIGWTIHCSDQLIIFVTDILITRSDCICFSNMTSFTGYINNTVIKLLIYFNPHIHIFNQIINIIPKWFHVFTQDRGAYNHKNILVLFLYIGLFWKNTEDNHLSTLTFVICRLPVTLISKECWWY